MFKTTLVNTCFQQFFYLGNKKPPNFTTIFLGTNWNQPKNYPHGVFRTKLYQGLQLHRSWFDTPVTLYDPMRLKRLVHGWLLGGFRPVKNPRFFGMNFWGGWLNHYGSSEHKGSNSDVVVGMTVKVRMRVTICKLPTNSGHEWFLFHISFWYMYIYLYIYTCFNWHHFHTYIYIYIFAYSGNKPQATSISSYHPSLQFRSQELLERRAAQKRQEAEEARAKALRWTTTFPLEGLEKLVP